MKIQSEREDSIIAEFQKLKAVCFIINIFISKGNIFKILNILMFQCCLHIKPKIDLAYIYIYIFVLAVFIFFNCSMILILLYKLMLIHLKRYRILYTVCKMESVFHTQCKVKL